MIELMHGEGNLTRDDGGPVRAHMLASVYSQPAFILDKLAADG
jgi:hypothetical protein